MAAVSIGAEGLHYTPPSGRHPNPMYLVANAGVEQEQRYVFYDRLEIGRYREDRVGTPGLLLVADPTVSWRHCVITQTPDGRCYVRDLSRNGTRLDGRRLVPNLEIELRPGQSLAVGADKRFLVKGGEATAPVQPVVQEGGTVGAPGSSIATILVGDIRDYTVLVRKAPARDLHRSVNSVFEHLSNEVVRHTGTVKEYQGDAIFAFWEGRLGGEQATRACRAALALDRLSRRLAVDRRVWNVPGFSLQMDWALATGPVVLDTFGGAHPSGLSLIGEPVVLAFRLEKLANDKTGSILACPYTRATAAKELRFRDLGEMLAKGFESADHVFALTGDDAESVANGGPGAGR